MKNVTIDIDDALYRWARIEAAKADKSLSRWIADRLGDSGSTARKRHAAARFLAAPDLPGVATPPLSREDLYAERLFHRHKRVPVRKGSANSRQASARRRVDRSTGGEE